MAYKTYELENINPIVYQETYDKLAKEFNVLYKYEHEVIKKPYGVIHLRGIEKIWYAEDYLESTRNIVKFFELHGYNNWIVITDDINLFERFPSFLTYHVPPIENEAVATFRDFSLLLNATLIVQHSPYGWSSFSNLPAFIRKIPIINTYPTLHNSLLKDFETNGGLPTNFFNYQQTKEVLKFIKEKEIK